jgi:hypothetical protein
MRVILVLMKREIIDHAIYFVAAALAAGLAIALGASIVFDSGRKNAPSPYLVGLVPLVIFIVVGLSALGISQMYVDRMRSISAFLLALPVKRAQIFTARVLTGVLVILTLVVPLTVAGQILVEMKTTEMHMYRGLLGDLFWGISLACLACYAIGLYAGWNARAIAPTLLVLPVALLIPFLIVAKGFGIELDMFLLVLIVAGLAGTWLKFSGSAL